MKLEQVRIWFDSVYRALTKMMAFSQIRDHQKWITLSAVCSRIKVHCLSFMTVFSCISFIFVCRMTSHISDVSKQVRKSFMNALWCAQHTESRDASVCPLTPGCLKKNWVLMFSGRLGVARSFTLHTKASRSLLFSPEVWDNTRAWRVQESHGKTRFQDWSAIIPPDDFKNLRTQLLVYHKRWIYCGKKNPVYAIYLDLSVSQKRLYVHLPVTEEMAKQ